VCFGVLSITNFSKFKGYQILLLFFGIVLIIIATLRPSDMPDWRNYYHFFNSTQPGRFEAGFLAIRNFVKSNTNNFLVLLFLMASLSISVKIWCISKMTPLIWLSMMVYISNIFVLHDMIQIRAAVASGMLLLAVFYKVRSQFIPFIVTTIIAFLFHYSAILILPIWFLSNTRRDYFYLWLIPIGYTCAMCDIYLTQLLTLLRLDFIENTLQMYGTLIDSEMNIFNIVQLLRCVLCFWFWYKINIISSRSEYAIILLKIYTIGIAAIPFFSNLPVAAFRISELYLVVEILLLPLLLYSVNPQKRIVGKFSILSLSSMFLFLNILYLNILK
jgi:hypothetical protein